MRSWMIVSFLFGLSSSAASDWQVQRIPMVWPNAQVAVSQKGERFQGGHSGLFCESAGGSAVSCWTHTDRGPNGDASEGRRPFLDPSFQPRVLAWSYDGASKVAFVSATRLTQAQGKPLTGLPNLAGVDETPVRPDQTPLAYDPTGMDLEGIVRVADGFWMVEEYGPSIVKFDASGRLQERFVPAGNRSREGTAGLAAHFALRENNRGFEGIALANGKLYATMQSPLKATPPSRWIHIAEFDPKTKKQTGEYLYPLEASGSDRIGDLAHAGDFSFDLIEHDGKAKPDAVKRIYRADFSKATNVMKMGAAVDAETPESLAKKGVRPAAKTLVVDLAAVGLGEVEKFEGVSVLPDGRIALVDDNDFGVRADSTVDAKKASTFYVLTPKTNR